jgi:hypothetical protein
VIVSNGGSSADDESRHQWLERLQLAATKVCEDLEGSTEPGLRRLAADAKQLSARIGRELERDDGLE